jgi:hypothetical protein
VDTVPTVVVDGRPVVTGFYDARKLARALGLGPDDRPEEELWSLRELAYHSFAFNNRVIRALSLGEEITWAAVNGYIEECRAFESADQIAAAGLELHGRFRRWFLGEPAGLWERSLATFSGEQVAEDMLFFALGHMAFHLVQLYRYLRLIGLSGFEQLDEAGLLELNEPTTVGGGTELAAAH